MEILEIGLEKVWKKFGILCAWLAANPVKWVGGGYEHMCLHLCTSVVVVGGGSIYFFTRYATHRQAHGCDVPPVLAVAHSPRGITAHCQRPTHVYPVCKGSDALWCYHGNITRSGTRATRGKLPEPDTRRKCYPTQP